MVTMGKNKKAKKKNKMTPVFASAFPITRTTKDLVSKTKVKYEIFISFVSKIQRVITFLCDLELGQECTMEGECRIADPEAVCRSGKCECSFNYKQDGRQCKSGEDI